MSNCYTLHDPDPRITALEQEIAELQVTHPVELYQPGSVLLERLYEQMALAQKYRQPDELVFNL